MALQAPHLLHVDFKRTLRLTLGTGPWLHLLVLGLEEGSQHEVTLVTVVLHHSQLWEDTGAAVHHTTGADQLVQVELPNMEKRKCYWTGRNHNLGKKNTCKQGSNQTPFFEPVTQVVVTLSLYLSERISSTSGRLLMRTWISWAMRSYLGYMARTTSLVASSKICGGVKT